MPAGSRPMVSKAMLQGGVFSLIWIRDISSVFGLYVAIYLPVASEITLKGLFFETKWCENMNAQTIHCQLTHWDNIPCI